MADTIQIDFSDPCAALEQVRAAYYRAIAGGTPTWVEFNDRRVRYGEANAKELEKLIGKLEADCESRRSGGRRPRRYALSAGYRRG